MERRPLQRNDPCHCGSGKKYKRCHLAADLESGTRYTYSSNVIAPLDSLASLKKNTLDFIRCLKEELGIVLDPVTGQGFLTGDVSDGVIRRTFGRLPFFFPHAAPYPKLCEAISKESVTGFYWGSPDVNCVATHLTRYSLYTPRIIVTNPFCDMSRYHLDVSPLDHPSIWKQVVVNKALFLASIEPWIREGIIIVLPPIKWIDWEFFRDQLRPLAQSRLESFTEEQERALELRNFLDLARSFHPDDLPLFFETYMEGAPEKLVESIEQLVLCEYRKNPIRYAWNRTKDRQIMTSGSGNNLESAVFASQLCGSYMLFGEEGYKQEYQYAADLGKSDVPRDAYTLLSSAFSTLEFTFLNGVPLDFALNLRREEKLADLRTFLHQTWKRVSSIEGIENLSADAAFREELQGQYRKYKEEWQDIERNLLGHILTGAGETAAACLSGRLEFAVALGGLAAFQLKNILESYTRRKLHERLPLGIFLNLERSSQ